MNQYGPTSSRQKSADLTFAEQLVRTAGTQMLEQLRHSYKTEWKDDNTPVTTIDIDINRMVINRIKERYPEDRVYGEEESSSVDQAKYTWVLDPLDGTQALGIFDTFTICLARLNEQGEPLFGIIYNPSREELYSAEKGKYATCNDEVVHVSSKKEVKSSYIFFGSRLHFGDLTSNGVAYDRLESQGAKIINARSLAFGCTMVASGKAEGAYIGVETPFEAASAKLIIEGAGGRVTDIHTWGQDGKTRRVDKRHGSL